MVILGYILILLLTFYLLAKIVDDYFIEALDKIATRFSMSSDAAGATLMAVGSSAPELFVALFSVLHPGGHHEAIGIGNIVGSALFNILAITGAVAIVRKSVLAWQPIVRDLSFYAVSILLLLWVFHDGQVELFDAALFIGVYIIYVLVVVYWRRMTDYVDPNEEITVREEDSPSNFYLITTMQRPVDFVIDKLFPPKKYYFLIFGISILIIAGLSWVLVESAVQIAEILDISEAVIGVTILAAGTSVPDLLSSIIVSKQGRGGMAVSNAVGSNIFDILIGLGLPFLIIILLSGGTLFLEVSGLMHSVEFLLGSVFIVFIAFLVTRWKVRTRLGIFFLLLYAAYLLWAVFTVT
ncbi:MAG: calcium/sodium antiporter [Bacteroidota bacterium]|nr:calcium/sodium antiporter [Bacteroidota bacterium]